MQLLLICITLHAHLCIIDISSKFVSLSIFFYFSLLNFSDSIDTLRVCIDVGVQCGKQHRTKDIIAWAKKKRRHIRREELLAFLCGKNPPLRNRSTSTGKTGAWMTKDWPSQRLAHCGGRDLEEDNDTELQAFSDALALQGQYFWKITSSIVGDNY